MQPLQDLLHRIAWDPEFGRARFALGYEDRLRRELVIVPIGSIRFDSRRPGTFSIEDADGVTVHIPLHRVRAVYRDGEVIWSRPRRDRRADSTH